jgi:SAM-dependent methyltransferase
MPSVDETTRYFENHSDRLRADLLVDKSEALEQLLFSKLSPGSRVVEVGAGTGLYTYRLLQGGHFVTAVDLSQGCLDQIARKVDGTEFAARLSLMCGDFLDQSDQFESSSLDAVTFIKVLHHFPDRAAISQAIGRAYELLAPGGKLLIFEPNGGNPLWRPLLLSRGREYWRNEKNVMLIRRAFLEDVLTGLPASRVVCSYRFIIPGGVVRRAPALANLDQLVCRSGGRWLDYLAANIAFEVTKPQ